jgi:hypothetical protein
MANYTIEKAKIPVIIREIVKGDAEEYCNARKNNSKKVMLERLSKGHIGMCAIYEGKIICYVWQATDEIWLDAHKINLMLPQNYRFGYDGYTHPDYRRLGVYHELRTSSYSKYIERGYPMAVSLIQPDNDASIRAELKTGGKMLGVLHTTYFLWYLSHSIESDNEENIKRIESLFSSVRFK